MSKIFEFSNIFLMNVDSNCTLSLFAKVLSNHLHLLTHCDKLKAFRLAQRDVKLALTLFAYMMR